MQNDANCLAVSEASDGAAAGCGIVFGVILGTGVGGGVVIDGKPLTGAQAIAGEWGHNPLPHPRDDERPGPALLLRPHGLHRDLAERPAPAGASSSAAPAARCAPPTSPKRRWPAMRRRPSRWRSIAIASPARSRS